MAFDPVLELAENANTYTPLAETDERIVTDRWVLWMGRANHPAWNVGQRFRFRADELGEVGAEIHAAVRARGRTGCSWEIVSSATPPDLVDRLLALGLGFDDHSFAGGRGVWCARTPGGGWGWRAPPPRGGRPPPASRCGA